jgi:hypothetical protein
MNVYCSEEIAALASHQEIRGRWDLEHRRPSGTGGARGKRASEGLHQQVKRGEIPIRWSITMVWYLASFCAPFLGRCR